MKAECERGDDEEGHRLTPVNDAAVAVVAILAEQAASQ
jgi:hypothetical protein